MGWEAPRMNLSLRGRLTSDPELKTSRKNKLYCEVGVAYNTHGVGHPSDKCIFFKFMAYDEMAQMIAMAYSQGQWITIARSKAIADRRKCTKCGEWIGMPHFVILELDMSDLTTIPPGMEKYVYEEEA